MGRSRYTIHNNTLPCFITCTITRWLPLFSMRWAAETVLDSLRYLQSRDRITLYAFVLMENHLHLVASSTDLSKEIGDFKSYTARIIIDRLIENGAERLLSDYRFYRVRHKHDRAYQLWQEGMHPKQISSRAMMEQKIRYIHNNPVKRGYVDEPVHWRYSSARNYAGMDGVLRVEVEW